MIADVSAYTLAKFLHITLAMLWIGGSVMLQLAGRTALASRLPGRTAEFSVELAELGKKFYPPLSVGVLLLGFYLVAEGNWGFDSPWVSVAILGVLVSIVVGAAFLGPQSAKAAEMARTEGADAPGVRDTVNRVLRVGLMDIGLLVFIVFLMVTKLGD